CSAFAPSGHTPHVTLTASGWVAPTVVLGVERSAAIWIDAEATCRHSATVTKTGSGGGAAADATSSGLPPQPEPASAITRAGASAVGRAGNRRLASFAMSPPRVRCGWTDALAKRCPKLDAFLETFH